MRTDLSIVSMALLGSVLLGGVASLTTANVAYAGSTDEEQGTPGPDGATTDDGDESDDDDDS